MSETVQVMVGLDYDVGSCVDSVSYLLLLNIFVMASYDIIQNTSFYNCTSWQFDLCLFKMKCVL